VRTVRPKAMTRPRRPALLAFISAMLFAVVGAGPVLADLEQGHTGTVGFHELRDTSTAGAVCRYEEIKPSPSGVDYEAELKWIDVRPPKIRAISGQQRVGWRFIIERRDFDGTLGPWVVKYKSAVQRDVTTSTKNASFAMMGVRVNVPANNSDEPPFSGFRVHVKMFWYHADGSIQGSAKHLVERYKSVLGNADGTHPTVSVDRSPCAGWQAFIAG
jgi:hypothetical protein